jgi:hypothetical protein
MNDLEPWKIWAVTGVIVCLVLGSTAARVRPIVVTGGAAQADTLSGGERSTPAQAELSQKPDQYESYSYGGTHQTLEPTEYYNQRAIATLPITAPLYELSAQDSLSEANESDQDINVAGQMLAAQSVQSVEVAENQPSILGYSALALNDAPNISQDGLDFLTGAVLDESDFDQTYSASGNVNVVWNFDSGTGSADDFRLDLGKVVLDDTMNGLAANERVYLTQALGEIDGPINGPLSIDQPVLLDSLDEAKMVDVVRAQAAAALKEEILAQVEQEQAVVEFQKAAYIANTNLSRAQLRGSDGYW